MVVLVFIIMLVQHNSNAQHPPLSLTVELYMVIATATVTVTGKAMFMLTALHARLFDDIRHSHTHRPPLLYKAVRAHRSKLTRPCMQTALSPQFYYTADQLRIHRPCSPSPTNPFCLTFADRALDVNSSLSRRNLPVIPNARRVPSTLSPFLHPMVLASPFLLLLYSTILLPRLFWVHADNNATPICINPYIISRSRTIQRRPSPILSRQQTRHLVLLDYLPLYPANAFQRYDLLDNLRLMTRKETKRTHSV